MGHFTWEVAPEQLNRIEPGTVGWQQQEDKVTRRSTHNAFHRIIPVRTGGVPSDVQRTRSLSIKHGLAVRPFPSGACGGEYAHWFRPCGS